MKIDVKKAFDTVEWTFLLHVLKNFGYSQYFCNWIYTILNSARLSISINGKATGFFACTRGVRQGDPVSLILFCLAEEVINRGTQGLVSQGLISQMYACRGAWCLAISYMLMTS